jgi:hypothetical protein
MLRCLIGADASPHCRFEVGWRLHAFPLPQDGAQLRAARILSGFSL